MAYRIHLVSCSIEEGPLSYPLGALSIATALEQDEQLSARIDVSHYRYIEEADDPVEAALGVADRQFDAVGLSVYLYNRHWMETFCRTLRIHSPHTVLFAGGPEISSDNFLLVQQQIDFAIYGEGEDAARMVIKQLLDKTELSGAHIATRSAPLHTKIALPDIETLPSVLLHNESSLDEYRGVLWEMTRGCPFNCAFCFEGRGEKRVRHIRMQRIEKELEALVRHGVQHVFVLDPTFNLDAKRTVAILQLLKERAPDDMHFTFEVRAELLTAPMADLFASIFCSLQIGLQSVHPEVDSFVGRSFNKDIFSKNIALLNEHNIVFGLDLIIGLPNDTLQGFTESLDYAVSLQPSNIDIFALALLPATALAAQSDQLGIHHLKESPYTVIDTPTMTKEDIEYALRLKDACDVLYTKGSASMWFNKACEGLLMLPSEVFASFISWAKHTDADLTGDPYELQDRFFNDIYHEHKLEHLLPVMMSFIELHQGIAYLQETSQAPVVSLSYDPDDLARLDSLSPEEFYHRFEAFPTQQDYYIYMYGQSVMYERIM